MKIKKIPGRVGKYPTHYALVCSKRGCKGKLKAFTTGELWDFQCEKCGMRYAKVDKVLDPDFKTYYYTPRDYPAKP